MPSQSFDELIDQVRQVGGSDPLARLDAAVTVGTALADQADHLLDHFVAESRQAGHSWTAIGERLGVTKQAARQRFAGRTETLALAVEPRPRLRACLARAEIEARADGSTEVGTDHLLLGLLTEGVAAAILERVGVTAAAIRTSRQRLFGPTGPAHESVPPMSAESIRALDVAAQQGAAGCADQPPWFGTEHLLAALTLDPGSRARRVLNDLDTDIASIKRELGSYVNLGPRSIRRRWWRHRPEAPACSFCARPRTVTGRVVTGPGVHICSDCTRICAAAHDHDDTRAAEPPDAEAGWGPPPP